MKAIALVMPLITAALVIGTALLTRWIWSKPQVRETRKP